MKATRIQLLIKGALATAFILYTCSLFSCKKDDPKPKLTEAEKVTQMLTANGGTWTPEGSTGITVDGIDVTQDLFAGFSMTFAAGTFTTTGTTPVWLRQDTWSFKDETATIFIRGQDNKEVTIANITESDLTLTLEWDQTTTDEGGRKRSLADKHQFVLKK